MLGAGHSLTVLFFEIPSVKVIRANFENIPFLCRSGFLLQSANSWYLFGAGIQLRSLTSLSTNGSTLF